MLFSERSSPPNQIGRRRTKSLTTIAIVKRHLLEATPVSKLCDEFEINPTLFYQWQRQLFENAHLAFENGRKARAVEDAKDKKIEQLEAKLGRKNEVMAELMEEHTLLKKELGEA
ncbi:MAG: transposase [Chromatiaceae bacterium]